MGILQIFKMKNADRELPPEIPRGFTLGKATKRALILFISIIECTVTDVVVVYTCVRMNTHIYTRVSRRPCTAGGHKISLMPFRFKFGP